MPLIAESEHTISGPIDTVFSQFIDFRRWSAWMPKLFRPLRGPSRPLRSGDRILVSLSGAPSLVKVELVAAPHQVVWSGGLPGLLFARHTFMFEAVGDQSTRIRSVEPWTGLVTHLPPLASRIQRVAAIAGRKQIEGFDRWFRAEYATYGR